MHFRLQQAKRRLFSEAALDPNDYTFGNISNVLVGDFGQLEPIEDWSMCDTEATFQTCPKTLRHLWRHACQMELLMHTCDEAVMLSRIHNQRSQAIGATGFPQLAATGYCSHRLATTTRLQVISDTGFPCGHMQHSESDG